MYQRVIHYFKLMFWLGTILHLSLDVHANSVDIKPQDFKVKAFHLDLRIQVMKMPALKDFALRLSKQGINMLIMEWEASYPYEKHQVITGRYAYSKAEIRSFIGFCDSLKIDVVPLQQSFGHVEYILRNPKYKNLREDQQDYSQVNPVKEDSCKALFADLYKDLISSHHSRYLHIGGDETYLLGHSPESKKKVDQVGKGRLYGDYIKMLCNLVLSMGKRPIVWADIALKYPEALKDLPKETIFVDWNYGWPLDRFGDHKKLMKSGFEIWGAAAMRSGPDNYFLTSWKKHFDNISSFIPQARELGYTGMVMTSWSTSGIYNNIFESATDILDMHAVRRVYPISGFNLLIDAYLQSLHSNQAVLANQFAPTYAKSKYGFNAIEGKRFWKAISRAPFQVSQGEVTEKQITINQLLDSAKTSLKELSALTPKNNQTEFAHYVLMAKIRVFYLTCQLVEHDMNLPTFDDHRKVNLLKLLSILDPKAIAQLFSRLNKDLLFDGEIALENQLREAKFYLLKEKLRER